MQAMGQQPTATQPQQSHRLVWISEPVYNDLMQHFKGTGAIIPAQAGGDSGPMMPPQMAIPSREAAAPVAMARGGMVRRRQPLANTQPFRVRYPGVNPRMARPVRMAAGGVINWPNVFDPNMIGPVDDQVNPGIAKVPPYRIDPWNRGGKGAPGGGVQRFITSHIPNAMVPAPANTGVPTMAGQIASAAFPAAATVGGGPATMTRDQMIASGLGLGNQPAPGVTPPWFFKPGAPPIKPPAVGPI